VVTHSRASLLEGAEPGAQPSEDLGGLDNRDTGPPRQGLRLEAVENAQYDSFE